MFGRLMNLLKGFASLFVSGLERRAPEALLEAEKENLRKQIAKFNEGLASHAGLCERLMSQVRRLEQEENELRAKTSAHLRAGNKDAAAQLALRFQTVSREVEENRRQLEAAEKTYQELLRARDVSVKAAREKIESLRRGLDDLKMKKALAELTEMAGGMVTSIGGSGDTLDRLHQMVEEERTNASGRVRVARDAMDMTEVNQTAAEQQALANQALAAFAAAEGIALEGMGSGAEGAGSGTGTAAPATPTKSMGSEGAS